MKNNTQKNLQFGNEIKLLKTFRKGPTPSPFSWAKSSNCVINLELWEVEYNSQFKDPWLWYKNAVITTSINV